MRRSPERPLLVVELSGHVTTDEACRLVRQASELVRADNLRAVWCDISSLEYGPAALDTVARAIGAALPAGARLAITGRAANLRGAARLARLCRQPDGMQTFVSAGDAERWLSEVVGPRQSLPATARRHIEAFTAAQPNPDPAVAKGRNTSAA